MLPASDITPMPDRIYVEMIPYQETVTASGLYLPAEKLDHDKMVKGTVLALGPGRTLPKSGQLVPFDVEVGDIIYCGTPENVGPVVAGDVMTGHIDGIYEINVKVV